MRILENVKSVDQQRPAVRRFLDQHRAPLGRQGAIVASWRRRGDRKYGPYYRLAVRGPDGRQHSVYLGPAGAAVEEVRDELSLLQAAHRRHRQLARFRRQLLSGLSQARRQLSQDLAVVGLRRQGSEIRGRAGLASAQGRPANELHSRLSALP